METTRRDGVDRRSLLRGLAAAGAAGLVAPSLAARTVAPAKARNLVLLQLSGGNDGLSTVVPYADDAYHAARTATRIGAEEVLILDEHVGLHPALRGLREVYERGQLAIVQGVGYTPPNRSHFKSLDIWHAADRAGRSVSEGWIGRLQRVAFGADPDPNRVVHVGGKVPYSLHSSLHPPVAFSMPQGYRWVKNEDEVNVAERRLRDAETTNDSLAYLRGVMHEARESSASVRAATERYRPGAEYPGTPTGDALRTAAALLHGELGTRIVSIELGGFDTHNDQRRRHDVQMRTLDESLTAFLHDLGGSEVGRQTIVLAFSEFGRRVAENGSKGTDHGTAGPLFVAGAAVRGGLHGELPSLTELDEGDLVYTTDFRAAYDRVIAGCFGVDPAAVLGQRFPGLELLSA